MKVCNKHIISLFTLIFCFISFTSKAENKLSSDHNQKQTGYVFNSSDISKINVAIVEEVNVLHADQQNESQPDFSAAFNEPCQSVPLHIPVLDTYTKALQKSYTKKQQLLDLIFPFHYFY